METQPRSPAATDDDHVILVDAHDTPLGTASKYEVHQSGALHRAVSVFVFNAEGALLLQRRARGKYHSPLRWSNTACGHPRPGESTLDAARRRLEAEMGLTCPLQEVEVFTYRADLTTAIEHEVDHLFVGFDAGDPRPDPTEVDAWQWSDTEWVLADSARYPERYTAWIRDALIAVLRTTPAWRDAFPNPR